MNKELINKYWEEFCHWKDGGNLLCQTEHLGTWYEVTDEKWDFVCDITFIINDEYIEFRKALIEGKTIQHLDLDLEWVTWVAQVGFTLPLQHYRIKPGEPKFKVGDWVRHEDTSIGVVKCIITLPRGRDIEVYWKLDKNGSPLTGYNAGEHKSSKLTPWQPKPDEWCWFWNHEDNPILGQFIKNVNEKYQMKSIDGSVSSIYGDFLNCEPFIGTLPTHLKESA